MMRTISLLIILCSVSLSKQADVINSGEETIIDLDPQKTYEYEFFVRLKVSPQSNSNDSQVHDELRGLMEVTRDVGCSTTIVLRHVTGSTLVIQRNNTKYIKAREDDIRSYFEKPIEFCYDNGRVTQIKMHNLDSTWSLNLKRALISQMQISTESLELLFYTTESDVSGECLTEYIPVKSESGIVTLVKRKYSAGCSNKIRLEFMVPAYEVQPPTHSSKLPFLDGTSSCEVQIASNKTILQSDCEETLSIRSTTLQSEQWTTVVQTTTQLKLVGITEPRNSKLDGANALPTSLKLEYSDVFKDRETKPMEELQLMFRKIYSFEQSVDTEEFYKLTKQLRTLDKDQLNRFVTGLLETNPIEMRSRIIDILVAAGTEVTLEFMYDNSETLGMKPLDKVKALLAVKNPSPKVIHILKRAMEENFHPDIPLTISLMVNKICKQHQECNSEGNVQRIFEMLMQHIPDNCEHHTHKQLEAIMTSLHAVGNLGSYADVDNLTNVIRSCFNNHRVDISVKVAAIESLRRIGCNSLVNELLWNYLSEQNEDFEVRINAYRSYMYCPTTAKVKNSIRLLKKETSQQVGSYIYSYLKESLAAGSPNLLLKSVGQPFEQEILEAGRAFSLSSLSYSKHYARSLNIGKGLVFLETSVIFCPESPIPRSIAMNISLAVFGQMLNLIEVGIRTTEQREIVKYIRHLFQRLTTEMSVEAVQPDEFDSQFAKRKNLVPITVIYVKTAGTEKMFFRELLRTLTSVSSEDSSTEEAHSTVKTNSISVLMESRLSLSTIAGYELSYQWVLLGSSMDTISSHIGPKFIVHLDVTESFQFNEDLQLDGPLRRVGGTSQHQYAKFVLDLEGSGEANYNGQEVNLRLWLKPMPENHVLFEFKTNRYMYVEENILEMKPDSNKLQVRYESPQALNRLLGLKLVTHIHVASTWFPWSIPSRFTLQIHHFYGLEQTIQLKFGNSLLGSFKRLYFLFQRPGQKCEQRRNNDYAELLLHSDALNETTKFVHFKLALPLIHEVTIMVEINENGIIHARANVTGSPWELYGNHQPTAQQTMFTAQLLYPQGKASLVFRGNLTDNFKLFLHNRDDKRPFHLQMTQRFLLSRHHHYPMFRRIHHETVLQLLNNQTIDLQLEWNSGSRNGILEQGLAKLVHRSLTSETQMRMDVSWTEDVGSSDLDSSIEGYARKLLMSCRFERTGFTSSDISVGVKQFMSRDFWMLHTSKPAILSLHIWANSEHSPQLNANSSLVWQFGYRLDQGGKTNAQVTLHIPSKEIDAQLSGELGWRGHVKRSMPWLKHVEGYIILRVFPKQLARFLEANFSHTLEDDVFTSLYLTLSSNEAYSVHSHLVRGQNIHYLRIEWPTSRRLEIETTYRLQIESKRINTAITHTMKSDGEPLALLHTAVYYEFLKRKLQLIFNASKLTERNVHSIAYFRVGSELHSGMNFSPFDLNYVAAGDVQVIVPLINVDFGVELLSTLQLMTNNGLMKLVILHRCSQNDTKNGIDFSTSYDYQLNTFVIKSILTIDLPQYALLEPKRYAGWDFHLTIKDRQRQITFDGSHASFGSLLFHEKYRKFVGAETRFDGSAMFAVSPFTPIGSFAGLYINYNYAMKYSSYQYGIEFHGEYNPRSGTGPGTPLRFNVQFTHDGLFRYGNFELVLNSQALGYWTGYEMTTIMSKYTTEGMDSETRNRTWTCRSILGYRLLEGRGTRALESAVQLTFSPHGDMVSLNVRAGLPGNINQNILECGYIFYPDRLQVRTTVVVWNHDKLNARLSIAQNNNWETLKGEIVIKIPMINFDFTLSEIISITDDIILKENTEFAFCCWNLFNCTLQKEILILEKREKNKSDRVGQMTWYSTINWLGNGSLRTSQIITERTKKQHLVTFLWNDCLIFGFDMIQSPVSSTYNFTGSLGNKQVSALVNDHKFEVQGVRGESIEVLCRFPARDFDFQLIHHSNHSRLSHTEEYLASQRFYLQTGLFHWTPVAWQQTFAQTTLKGSLRHILLVTDIDTANAQFLHFTINYTDDKVLHTKLLIVPEIISQIGLENISFTLDTQQFYGANENKAYSLSLFLQVKPWFPPTSGTIQLNLDSLECEDVVCESQVAGQVDSIQSELTKIWRVQGSMQRYEDKKNSLYSYHSLLTAGDHTVTHRFAISFGSGPKTFFIFGNVTGEQCLTESDIKRYAELIRLQLNYHNNDTEFVSIFKLNILETPLLYLGINKFKSEIIHRISFDFNIRTLSDPKQTCELHILLNKDSKEITFSLKNGSQDDLAVTGNDLYFGTNLFHILQKRDSPEQLKVILKLFETFLNTTIDFDHVFGLVTIIHQNNKSLTGMVQFQELIGEEQQTVQMFILRMNSSMSIIPSSIFQISLQKFYFQSHDILKKVITHLETEVENLLPKKHINLTLSLSHRDKEPLILSIENLYISPFRAVLQLIQTSNSYSYKHRLESLNVTAESTSVHWNSTADCEVGSQILVDCSIKQLINGRVIGTLLDLKPHTGNYAVAAIWDEENYGIIGFTISVQNNSREFQLQTPLRYLTLKREKKQTPESHTETTRWVVHSVPVDQTAIESEERFAHMAITWTRMNPENNTIYSQWFSGIELDSDFIRKNQIGVTVNVTCNDKSAALFLSPFTGENLQPKPALVIRINKLSDSSIYSEQSVQFDDHHMQLTGIHEIQASHFTSANLMKLNKRLFHLNVSIDLWNKIYIMDNLGSEFLYNLNRSNKGLIWQQRAFIPELINLRQETHFNFSPICITSHMSSMRGKANLLAWKPDHDSYLVELSHKPSSGHNRADVVVRLSENTNGQLNVIARWRPTFLEEALFHGTELTDIHHIKKVISMSFQSIVLWGRRIRALVQEKANGTVDLRKLQIFRTCLLKDLQAAPDTIAKWLENDVLFVRTLNVPVLKELAKFSFYELEKNVTKSLSTYISVVNYMLNKCFSETNWTLEWLNNTKTIILNERLQAMRSTVVELLKMTNLSLQLKSKAENYLFQQVVGAIGAVYNVQTRVLDWLKMMQEQITSITLSPLADICREFGAYLVEQAPGLEPLKLLLKTNLTEFGELLMKNLRFWSELVFGSFFKKNGNQLSNSSSSDQLENASRIFASSELNELRADLDQGLIQFTTYIPPTLRTFYGYVTNTDSYLRQIMSWIYPKHGMKSVIYLYDQYQKNFDAIKKLINLIPPYSVSGWLVIGPHRHAHLVTFNNQFFLLPKFEKISYLLLRDINTNIFRIVQYFDQSSWSTTVEFGAIRIDVNNLGEVRKLRPGDEDLLPLPYKVEHSGAFIYIERSMDRITLHGGHHNFQQKLYTVHFDIGLQLIQFILDGHWQGNCRGLLGSHSFDQIEELKNPSGMQMVNSWTAAEAWSYRLNQTTPWKAYTNKTYLSTSGNVILKKQCTTYFNKLVACYSVLNVKPWLEACQVNSTYAELSQLPELEVENKTEAQMEINEHICRIVKGYVQSCNQQDVPVRVPNECVECKRSLKADGLTQIEYTESPARTGHVIFVLQLHQCMTERKQEISELLRILTHEKRKQTVFFCVVFDGAQEYQSLSWLTSKSGNLNMTGQQFLQTLEAILQNRQALKTNDTTSTSTQVLDAVMAVVRRPSPSAPVHESILLYSCGKCDATTSAMYGTVQRMLQRKGMEFHYLPFTSFKTAEGISTDSFLLQSDGSMTEFSGSNVNVRLNMGSVIPPRDQCSIVSQTSKGYIWAYRDVATSLTRKRLIATTLAKILTRPVSVTKLCHCRDNLFGQGQLDCVSNNSANALST